VVAGFYEQWRNTLYNSAIYVRLGDEEGGDILHVHRKNFLPTYGMFDEQRYVEAGLELSAFDTPGAGPDSWFAKTPGTRSLDPCSRWTVPRSCSCAWQRPRAVWGPECRKT